MHIVTTVMKIGPTVNKLRSMAKGGDVDITKVVIGQKAVADLFGGKAPEQIAGIPVEIDSTLTTQQARLLLEEKI